MSNKRVLIAKIEILRPIASFLKVGFIAISIFILVIVVNKKVAKIKTSFLAD